MALIALSAPTGRSTNRSTPTMAITGCQLQNVTAYQADQCVPRSAGHPKGEPDVVNHRAIGS